MRKIHLDKFPERPEVLKTTLMYISEKRICDGCDTKVKCACLSLLGGGTSNLCQDCIEGILEELDFAAVRNRKMEKIGI
jgi:hypothetical protein